MTFAVKVALNPNTTYNNYSYLAIVFDGGYVEKQALAW